MKPKWLTDPTCKGRKLFAHQVIDKWHAACAAVKWSLQLIVWPQLLCEERIRSSENKLEIYNFHCPAVQTSVITFWDVRQDKNSVLPTLDITTSGPLATSDCARVGLTHELNNPPPPKPKKKGMNKLQR